MNAPLRPSRVLFLGAAFVLLVPGSARADTDFQFGAGLGAGWIRHAPDLTLDSSVALESRTLDRARMANRGNLSLVGGYIDAAMIFDDRWQLPLFGGGFQAAVGTYPAVVTSADGSVARLRPWSATRIEILLPGLGFRTKHRRWLFGGMLRTGISQIQENVTVAGGARTFDAEANAQTLLVTGQVEGCRRLDPVTRLCLEILPRFYEFGFVNGVTFGVRMEWGR